MKSGSLVIYGATGTTGRGMVRLAVEAGLSPIVAGRNETQLRLLAEPHGLEVRVADLSFEALNSIFADAAVIVSCVGPYTHFGLPVLQAAITRGAHYVDFTGEPRYVKRMIDEFDQPATAAGSVLVPSAGLGVCSGIAAHLCTRGIAEVEKLMVIYAVRDVKASTGTAQSVFEILAGGAPVLDAGVASFIHSGRRLTRVPGGLGVTFPLTDPLTLSRMWPRASIQSFHQTAAAPLVWLLSPLMALADSKPALKVIQYLEKRTAGASPQEAAGKVDITVIAEGNDRKQSATVEVDNMYDLTYRAGFEVVRSLLTHQWPAGVRSSAQLLGEPEKIAGVIGVRLRNPSISRHRN